MEEAASFPGVSLSRCKFARQQSAEGLKRRQWKMPFLDEMNTGE